MRSLTVRALAVALLFGATALTASAQRNPDAEKISKHREVLNQKITLDFNGQNINDALEHLRQKTKLTVTVDPIVLQIMGIGIDGGVPGQQMPCHLKVDNGPVRVALQRMLASYNLTYLVLPEGVYITMEQFAYNRLVRQRVSVDVSGKPLAAALKDLAAETGATFIIDPRVAREAENKVELKLEDATLETAARLLAEVGGLKVVPVGNVLFVTDEKKAAQIRKENLDNQRRNQNFPDVFPGQPFRILPGLNGGGFGGFGGQALPGRAVPVPPPPPPPKDVPPLR
jgi:type II secretory pathway component GspD/PulD (secretin)